MCIRDRAVRASCSYPGVFSPCPYQNTELIDGGIRENVPWRETKEVGAEAVSYTHLDVYKRKQ